MSNFKSDNPDPAKGTPAIGTPFKSDNPDPAKEKSEPEKSSLDQGKAPQNTDPETKEAGIFAACLASLCCCFAAEAVVLNDDPTP
ncbi:hypothetical protein LOK49_LG02G03171 [Camellia lanceoleosa]|uniref:Uncharacterized protein n=1 Tax=Camellia lanceoleosa TaxID=1840588 RepID=A0ACC0IMY1_9ERIC|nr:hypothetical protein LOK49_LG02G03171 [Camellia lanceoleosa]